MGHIWCLEASPNEPTVGEALQFGPKTLLRKLQKHQGGYECNCVSLLQFSPPAPVGILLYLFMSPFLGQNGPLASIVEIFGPKTLFGK